MLAALALAALAVAATWPVASDPAHLSVVRPTENDYRLNNYLIFWGAHAMVTSPLDLHHTNMFHPERYTFAYADILLAHSLLMLPVIELFYNPVLTFNLLLIVGLTIGGLGFFFLAREITDHSGAAFLAAVLWAFNPVHFTRYQQIQLLGDHWLPWMAWALLCWLQPNDDTGSVGARRWPAAAAGFFCLNALSGSHNAVFGALLAGLMITYIGLTGGRWRSRAFVVSTLTFALLCVSVLAPIYWPYLLIEDQMAAVRAETLDLAGSSLRPLELMSARSRFYSWLDETVGWPSMLNPGRREVRAYAFPGVVVLVLAIAGMVGRKKEQRRRRGLWIVALAVFTFLAMGAYGGYLLFGNVPLFRLIRVPIRFMMPAVFALAVLAAYGAAAFARRFETPARQAAALLLIGMLFAGEATFAPLRTWSYAQEPRALNEFLAQQPGDFAIVEFPLDPFGYAINMRQVFQSIFHWKRLLVGYSGFQSQENIDLLRRIRDRFPAGECLDELLRLDVRFVVLLADRVEPSLRQAVAAQPRLEPTWSDEGWLVYRVLPASAPSR